MSSRHAAFLRGINLGRRRRVGGDELRRLFGDLGFDDVATFRTSGNVVFAAAGGRESELRSRIEHALEAALGYEVAVFLRSAKQVRGLANERPFKPAELKQFAGPLSALPNGERALVRFARKMTNAAYTVTDDEVKYGLAVTGRADPRHLLTNAGARPGDRLVITKPIGTAPLNWLAYMLSRV